MSLLINDTNDMYTEISLSNYSNKSRSLINFIECKLKIKNDVNFLEYLENFIEIMTIDNVIYYTGCPRIVGINLSYRLYLKKMTTSYKHKQSFVKTGYNYYKKQPEFILILHDEVILKSINNIIDNVKLIIHQELYDFFHSIIFIINGFSFYKLSKENINIMKCYNMINNYMIIDMIYLPEIYRNLLHSDMNIKIEMIDNIPISREIGLYYEHTEKCKHLKKSKIYKVKQLIFHKIHNIPLLHLAKQERSEEKEKELRCMTNLSNIFQHFNYLCEKFMLPLDVWKLLDAYLEKNNNYIKIIIEIYKKIKIDNEQYKFNDEILLIEFNKVMYFNGVLSLF